MTAGEVEVPQYKSFEVSKFAVPWYEPGPFSSYPSMFFDI